MHTRFNLFRNYVLLDESCTTCCSFFLFFVQLSYAACLFQSVVIFSASEISSRCETKLICDIVSYTSSCVRLENVDFSCPINISLRLIMREYFECLREKKTNHGENVDQGCKLVAF